MTTANISISLVIILAIVVTILNKKSNERHNANASSISEARSTMKDVAIKNEAIKAELDLLRYDANQKLEKAEATENALFTRIDDLKEETDLAIKQAAARAGELAFRAFSMAEQHIDEEIINAIAHADEQHEKLTAQFKERNDSLTSMLISLKTENAKLREELAEQKKKLNFYAGIEEAAENLTVKDNAENRAQELKKPLDKEQATARDYMENSTENVFVTGKAGTGKSFLLEKFRSTTKKNNIVLAPTGIAALNVKGATLHSAFGYNNLVNLDVDNITEETIRLKSEKRSVLRQVDAIIIDEISMVRADTFDKIDRILKVISRLDKPFGGKQMFVFGDVFQLPPVTKGVEYEYLHEKYGGVFFFHSDAYKKGNFKFVELTENHRQKEDKVFFDILNRIREGNVTDADIGLLNTRYTPDESVYDRFTALFPTKVEAERVNRSHMKQLETAEYVFKARIVLDKNPNKNKSLENIFPISEELRLRNGANVMMVANDPEGRWVNGTLGIIEKLSQDRIVVSFGTNRNYEVQQFEFEEQEITYADGKIKYETVFSVMQYPIVPAYAITIHKSQGQTYNNVMCDIDQCFASGQAYVALSRCASLEGLHLKSYITPASIKVDHDVLDFYHSQTANDLLKDNISVSIHQ